MTSTGETSKSVLREWWEKEYGKLYEGRIVLDYPMDLLFDRRCELERYESGAISRLREESSPPLSRESSKQTIKEKRDRIGGLSFPAENGGPGSGNVLLVGRPGTGKSTLALQWATVCTQRPNKYSSLFISLEETAAQVRQKAADLGWKRPLRELRFCRIEEDFSQEQGNEPLDAQVEALKRAIGRPEDCIFDKGQEPNQSSEAEACKKDHKLPEEGRLFLATLTPKARNCDNAQRTFDERYRQLEDLLSAFQGLRKDKEEVPLLRMVCIDGLASFGDGPLSREQIRQLFSLFQRCGVVGICTAEEAATTEVLEMEYLADIVVHLRNEEDGSYLVRHLEITKSRYQQQINGRHPFRIRPPRNDKDDACFQSVIVTPSIHYVSHATPLAEALPDDFDIGSPDVRDILPHGLKRPAVVTVRGKSGTYKSSIAHNFLVRGSRPDPKAADPKPESALLLTLSERTRFTEGEESKWLLHASKESDRTWKLKGDESINDGKLSRSVWEEPQTNALLIEIAFKQGALLPEEFIEYVRDAFRLPGAMGPNPRPAIGRVVLDDVSMIGPSYPLLRHSRIGGDLCLSTLVHLMRSKGADLLMAGSPGSFVEADEMVNRACTLSDAVLSCDFCDIFGQRHVLVTGEGLMSGRTADGSGQGREGAVVPGVIVVEPDPEKGGRPSFRVDRDILRGLVGYEKGDIHRPGMVLHVFSEGDILRSYNRELETMLEQACASPSPGDFASLGGHDRRAATRTVTVQPYGSDRSEAIHDSLTILGRQPIDKTVLVAVDEFVGAEDSTKSDSGEKDGRRPAQPYGGPFAEVELPQPTEGAETQGSEYYVRNGLTDGHRLVPYYANVLVLAYNTSLVPDKWQPRKWSEILKVVKTPAWVTPLPPKGSGVPNDADPWSAFLDDWFARPLLKRTASGAQSPSMFWPFEAGAWSMETLACILLDAIASVAPGVRKPPESKPGEREEELLKFIGSPFWKSESVRVELTSLAYLFYYSWRHWALDLSRARSLRIEERMANKLVPNAAVYVCWYTQLRELIDEYPQLGSMLRVCPLPGGGFKGDWFLGILQGSVSHSLGTAVLSKLCSEDEERKRFVRGVGLPVRSSYVGNSKELLAWPRAKGMCLEEVIDIHQRALSRNRIPHYTRLRGMLGTFGRQIAFSAADEAMSTEGAVTDCIERLPMICRQPLPPRKNPAAARLVTSVGHVPSGPKS